MKVKEVDKTVNIAWSPEAQHPIYLAAGTAAQQLDASFSTSAALDIYSLNLDEPGPDLKLKCSIPTENRFHKLTWGAYGCNADTSQGLIIGGCDNGIIQVYNATKLLSGNSKFEVLPKKHSGSVRALDFNNFQKHLFASGGPDSEILVWDLLHSSGASSVPLGTKMTPSEDVVCLSWNYQVQHILGSVLPSKCVIWDLRKAEPIIKVTDSSMARIKWRSVTWNPDIATQLCLASEEDQNPVVEIWDLRFATTPIKVLQGYKKGVMSVSWSPKDSELLLGCGKDDHVICWNPNSATPEEEVVCRVQTNSQWNFDVAWCPRVPNLFAVSSYDGHMGVYSITGGHCQAETKTKIADSFPGMETYAETTGPLHQTIAQLKKPPKWLKRPIGASFAFGGKLVTFSSESRSVSLYQIMSDPGLMTRSRALEATLAANEYPAYCAHKLGTTGDEAKQALWRFVAAHFEAQPRESLISLLGYTRDSLESTHQDVAERLSTLDMNGGDTNSQYPEETITLNPADDFTKALLLGDVPLAVDLCIARKNYTEAFLLATAGTSSRGDKDLLELTRYRYFQAKRSHETTLLKAVVTGDWTQIVQKCDLKYWAEVLVAILSQADEAQLSPLCEELGSRLEASPPPLSSKSGLCYIASGNINKLVSSWVHNNGKSSQNIQDLVEVVLIIQKALQAKGRSPPVCGQFAELLASYAEMLTSQGDLDTALTYLTNSNSTDEKMLSLKNQIERALGVKPARQRLTSGNFYAQNTAKRTSLSGSTMYQAGAPTVNNAASPAPPTFLNNNVAPPTNTFNSIAPPSNAFKPIAPPTGTFNPIAPPSGTFNPIAPHTDTFNPVAPPTFVNNSAAPSFQNRSVAPTPTFGSGAVAPPTSFAPPPMTQTPLAPPPIQSPSPGPGLPSRSKYIVDPSVGGSPYSSQSYSRPQSSLGQPFPPAGNMYSPNGNVSQPGLNQGPSGYGTGPTGYPSLPASGAYGSGNSNQTAPASGPPPVSQSTFTSAGARTHTPGWNDPPTLSSVTKPSRFERKPASQPITLPMFGAVPTDQYSQEPPQSPALFTPSYTPMPTPLSSDPSHQPYYRNPLADAPPSTPRPPLQQASEAFPTPPVSKPPLPEEHMHIQTVCDELRSRVYNTATNPISKKKLEDVARKLELMYDALRESKLPPAVLQSLHTLIQLTQQGDYNGAIAEHTRMVSGPHFSDIASFMPGLKILIQMSLQCGVYL